MELASAQVYTKQPNWLNLSHKTCTKKDATSKSFLVSKATLSMMDSAIENLKNGNVSEAIDLTDFEV